MYSVYIVENDPIILEEIITGVAWLDNGFTVVGSQTAPQEAIAEIMQCHPDVIFTDLKMPMLSGIDLMCALIDAGLESEYVIFSAFSDFEESRAFFRLGGFDYLLKPLQETEMQLVLERLAAKLAQNTGDATASAEHISESFAELIAYVNENIQQKHTLEALGVRFHLNPNYICNLFVKYYDTTLTRYLTELRMTRALHLMQVSGKAYKAIAAECGYNDYFYFCKVFKSHYGAAPTKYMEHTLEG